MMKCNVGQKQIPKDWQVVKLGDIGVFSKGAGIGKDEVTEIGHNAVRYGELYTKHHFHIRRVYSHIPDTVLPTTKLIKYGDILFAGSGETINEIGKSAAYLLKEPCYAGGDIVVFTPTDADSLFLSYFLNVGEARKKLRVLGQGQSVVHVYKSDIEKITLYIPPLLEQKRIVKVLETWDRAIELTERKIALKREVKKGLMQRLLTGKVRLPGFSGEWKKFELQILTKPSSEKLDPTKNTSVPCVELEHLQKGSPFLLGYTDSAVQKSIKNVVRVGDVLFGKLRPYLRKHLFAEFDGACSTEIWVLRPTKHITNTYLYWISQTEKFVNLANNSSGSRMPRADWSYMNVQVFEIPDTEEQKKITDILKVADTDILLLVQKLTLLKGQKKYLLNNLVTGAIRTPETL